VWLGAIVTAALFELGKLAMRRAIATDTIRCHDLERRTARTLQP
jgi:hypothetical protein